MAEAEIPQVQEPEPHTTQGNKVKQFIAGYAAAMGGFNTGVTIGWASGAHMYIKKLRPDDDSDFTQYQSETVNLVADAFIISDMCLGCCVALLFTPFMMDKIGRKWTMVALLPLYLAVWLILAFIQNDPSYIIMRFASGIATGGYSITSPHYAAEIAEKSVRGALGVSYQLMVTTGIIYSFFMSLLPNLMLYNLVNIIPIVIFAVWIAFVPETPYFLMWKGHEDKARKNLQWLRGKHYKIDQEFAEIQDHVHRAKEMRQATVGDLVSKLSLRRAMIVMFLLMTAQQLSGIYAIIFNLESIFELAQTSKNPMTPYIHIIIIGCIQWVTTLVTSFVVDHFGRRPLMLWSMGLMSVFHIGLFIFFLIMDSDGEDAAGNMYWLPLVSLIGYIIGYSLGAGPIPWLMLGELFPEESKNVAASVCAIYSWLLAFIVTWIFTFLHKIIPVWIFFIVFSITCLLGLIELYFYLVETNNKSFEEIQNILEGRDPQNAPKSFRDTSTIY